MEGSKLLDQSSTDSSGEGSCSSLEDKFAEDYTEEEEKKSSPPTITKKKPSNFPQLLKPKDLIFKTHKDEGIKKEELKKLGEMISAVKQLVV